jgi:hypothetical protein
MYNLRGTSSLFLIAFLSTAIAQTSVPGEQISTNQIANVIGVEPLLTECAQLKCTQLTGQTATVQQLLVRQQITETVIGASLDVDSVLAEIANEHGRLTEVRSVLEARRDRAVSLASTANLIVGTGVGIAVNALQFKDSTAAVGDAIGVGSGVASTILSVIGIRVQNGPQHALAHSPKMLAVLFGREPVLHSQYPETVLVYLNSIPQGQASSQGTRLEQLRQEWQTAGRLGPAGSARAQKKIDLLTSGLDAKRRLSISDLTDRAYMLEDVAGRVSLMKRDLADLMRSLRLQH